MSSIPRLPHTFNRFLLDPGNLEAKTETAPEVAVGGGGHDAGDLAGSASEGYGRAK